MKAPWMFAAIALSIASANASQMQWQRYLIPQTGAGVDVPITIFRQDARPTETGFGRHFYTDDRRADLIVEAVPNPTNDSPDLFLAKKQWTLFIEK